MAKSILTTARCGWPALSCFVLFAFPLALVKFWIGKGESLKHLRLNGIDDGGVHWREPAGLLGELGVKVTDRLLATLQRQRKQLLSMTKPVVYLAVD